MNKTNQAIETKTTSTVYKGKVSFFLNEKGYGFVTFGDESYFFHRKNIVAKLGFQVLDRDDEVYFELGEYNGRPVAINVKRIVGENGGAK
jgi:CspA family cold shock protein